MTSRRQERGFTLVELLLTTAVAGIISTTIFGAMLTQQRSYLQQLAYAEAQQNARAALAIVQHYTRQAGFGLARNVTDGIVPIGACQNDAIACNGIDAGSDRLQVAFARAEGFQLAQMWEPGFSMFRIGPKTGPDPGAIPNGTKVMVSGPCKCPGTDCGKTAADLITITGDVNDGQWWHKYQYSGSLTCNYAEGFNFGVSYAAELYIDRTDAAHPTLMFDPDATGSAPPLVVAYDIEDLQVQYGLDTSTTPDNAVDLWCHNLALANCASGLASDTANQRRVIAVRAAIVARTREPLPGYQSSSLTVMDHTITGGDNYRRFVYRTTLALRSINL